MTQAVWRTSWACASSWVSPQDSLLSCLCLFKHCTYLNFAEDRGHTYIVTDDKEGDGCVLDQHMVRFLACQSKSLLLCILCYAQLVSNWPSRPCKADSSVSGCAGRRGCGGCLCSRLDVLLLAFPALTGLTCTLLESQIISQPFFPAYLCAFVLPAVS